MKQLLINADDLGLSAGASRGIAHAMTEGVVVSCSAMVAVPGAVETIARYASCLRGRIGLHLQLTAGTPCLPPEEVPTLVKENSVFPPHWRELGRPDPDEIRREWRAQLTRLRAAGVEPTHLDCHHNLHLDPRILPLAIELGQELGVRVRSGGRALAASLRKAGIVCTDHCIVGWGKRAISRTDLVETVDAVFSTRQAPRTVELVCHPGELDDDLRARAGQVETRPAELAVLTDPATSSALEAAGIELLTAPPTLSGERS